MMGAPLSEGWRPLLDGDLAAEACRAALDIRTDLLRRTALGSASATPAAPPGLASSWHPSLEGWAGFALLHAYAGAALADPDAEDLAAESLGHAIDGLDSSVLAPALYGGFCGAAWAIEHLTGAAPAGGEAGTGEEAGAAEDDPGEEIAAALAAHLEKAPWLHEYDLITGLVGMGVFALERMPRHWGIECAERVVARLAELAEPAAGGGVTWLTPHERLPAFEQAAYPDGCFNLGVAHGVAGVIPLLAAIHAAGVARSTAGPLLEQAVVWLLDQQQPAGADSTFAYKVRARALAGGPAPSPLPGTAWCYGDLGVATSLLAAARWVDEPAWEREAVRIARATAVRPPRERVHFDACICHGAAGNGHLFNRLYQATGDPLFEQAARHWFERALALRRPDRGIAGFCFWDVGDKDEMVCMDHPGFLNGATGVALALLAATSSAAPDWDRLLLVSIPSRSSSRRQE